MAQSLQRGPTAFVAELPTSRAADIGAGNPGSRSERREVGAPAFCGPGSREPRCKRVAACRRRSFAQELTSSRAETKNRPLCSRRRLHKGPISWCLFHILEEVCCATGSRPGAAVSRCRYDYFFRFDVFFATFFVAFAVFFFAFFAFLAMWSSVNDCFSEVTHAAYRHAQHTDITNAKLVPTSREVCS
jgi:hypothetical protein